MKLKIKVGDEVQVITGKDKGRKGAVLELLPLKQKIRVKDIRVQTCFDKKDSKIEKIEGFIDYSNVKLLKSAPKKEYKKSQKKKKGLFGK